MIALVLILISTVIMISQGNFSGFLNYSVMGMFEFTGNNLTIEQGVEIIIACYGVLALLSYILCFILYKTDANMKVLVAFGMALNLSAFPIFNLYHTSIAILVNVIILICIADKLLFEKISEKHAKVTTICLTILCYIILCGVAIKTFFVADDVTRITDTGNIYYSSYINKTLKGNLEEVAEYIEENEKVICISSDAALYMTYLGENNQELDLIFAGNLGYDGIDKTLDKISVLSDDTIILMNKTSYWQEISQIREYVIENYTKQGMVGECYIFTKE